jgi:hypothetical protein
MLINDGQRLSSKNKMKKNVVLRQNRSDVNDSGTPCNANLTNALEF